jgi:methyl-accepting chemotaxis protein
VTQSVQQMERVTQSNAAAAEEAAAASEELNSQAESTQDIARHLDELIGGRRLAASTHPVTRATAHLPAAHAASTSVDGDAADFDEPRTGTYN